MLKKRKSNPVTTKAAENRYGIQLRKISGQVADIVNSFPPGTSESSRLIDEMLRRYAEFLEPWARNTALKMLSNVDKATEKAFFQNAKNISVGIKRLVENTQTGSVMRQLLNEQVNLIKSIPLEAAQRVQKLTLEGLSDSSRGSEIIKEIMRSGEVAKSRANLIARTEIARSSSKLTEARAVSIGSEGYIWRTAHDSSVRHSHKEMEGKFVRWDSPPTLSDGTTTHAGQIYNCRCYAEVVIPNDD